MSSAGLPSAGLPSAGLPSAGLPSAGLPSADFLKQLPPYFHPAPIITAKTITATIPTIVVVVVDHS
ncbi:MAG: hypothetical protein LE169_05270 [Endomicrobium sp.]|nr:hypothetical protein [Endomicrobium sp.]